MEGRYMLLLVALVVMMTHSCCGSDPYPGYPGYPQPVVEQPRQTPRPPPITYCSFNRTRVLIDQQFQVRGYNVYRTCRAQAVMNTCSSGSCPQNGQCTCCKPSTTLKWVTQEVRYNCGFGDIKRVSWHTLQPENCICSRC